jgi:hypothetical protein
VSDLPLVRKMDAPQYMDITGVRHDTHEKAAEASVHALVLESVRSGYNTWHNGPRKGDWQTDLTRQLTSDFIIARKPPVR